MFFLLEKFIEVNNADNVRKIYKSITFSLVEHFEDFFIREIISNNLKATILKMGLNVNVLAEPLLLHYKALDMAKFTFSACDFQLIEFLMLTIE